jgi:hypothetical protein
MSENPQHRRPVSAATDAGEGAPRTGRLNVRPINLLLVIPLIGVLPPMFYNGVSPRIGGMPFFYWYQLLWIPISVAVTFIVYRATRGER